MDETKESISLKDIIIYIFCLTILPQIIVIATFASVCFFAYWGVSVYNDAIMSLVGAGGFIVMMFIFLCVSILLSEYGNSLFSALSVVNVKDTTTVKEVYLVQGRANTFTGKRPIEIREREKKRGGGAFILATINCLIIALIGTIQFVVELILIFKTKNRLSTWASSREYFLEKMEDEGGAKEFFKTPIICAKLLLVVWAIILPVFIINQIKYNPKRLDFEVSGKETSQYNSTLTSNFDLEVKNNGRAKIVLIEGIFHFKNREGKELYSGKLNIRESGDYLEKNESWNLYISVFGQQNDENIRELYITPIEDIEITFVPTKINYKGSKNIYFDNEKPILVKAFD